MIQLLWGLLNIALFIYFLYTCLQALKLVRSEMGRMAAFVLGMGLFSFVCVSKDDNNGLKSKAVELNTRDSVDKNRIQVIWVDLDHSWVNRYTLMVEYGYHTRTGLPVPLKAYSTTDGLTISARWQPSTILTGINHNNNLFEFEVNGDVSWELLGIGLINQSKTYKQLIKLE